MHLDYTNKMALCNTNDICAVDVEQIFIPLANNAENEITPMVYADDTGQITI